MNAPSETIVVVTQARAEIQRAVIRAAADASGLTESVMTMALVGLASLPTEHGDLALRLARQDWIRVHNAEARRRSHR